MRAKVIQCNDSYELETLSSTREHIAIVDVDGNEFNVIINTDKRTRIELIENLLAIS